MKLHGVIQDQLVFPFTDLYAYATQDSSPISESAPATRWKLIGTDGVLPLGLSLQASWADLSRAYGRAYAASESSRVVVRFCSLPRMSFLLDPEDLAGDRADAAFDAGRIPAHTRVFSVAIQSADEQPLPGCEATP